MLLRRKRSRLDRTPCSVDVAPGTLVYWDGEQRSGTIHDVPRHLALKWLKYRYVTAVHDSAASPASSPTASRSRAGHDGDSYAEPAPAPGSPQSSKGLLEDDKFAADVGELTDGECESATPSSITAGQRRGMGHSPSHPSSHSLKRSVKNALYASREIDPEVCQACQWCGSQLTAQVKAGRPRRWCSDACRKRAARQASA